MIYGECNKNIKRICDIFADKYPQKQKSSRRALNRIILNFKTFGSVKGNFSKRKPIVDDENIEIAVLGYFATYPRQSLRQAARESGFTKDSIYRILKKHNFHPYAISIVQHLKKPDFQRRVNICECILTSHYGNNLFLDNVI